MRQYNSFLTDPVVWRIADISGFRIRAPAFLPLGGSLWRDNFPVRVSFVFSRTARGKADSSLVRRVGGGMVGLPGFLSDGAAAGLFVCDGPDALSEAGHAKLRSCRVAVVVVSTSADWTGS